MDSKIRIKMGEVEIEFQGEHSFIKKDLLELAKQVIDLAKEYDLTETDDSSRSTSSTSQTINQQGTTQTLASKLGSKTGPDLATAAAARLTFVLSSDSFSRQQILDEMKSAKSYFKQSMAKNLSSILSTLIKNGTLFESAKDTFALSAQKREELEKQLAG